MKYPFLVDFPISEIVRTNILVSTHVLYTDLGLAGYCVDQDIWPTSVYHSSDLTGNLMSRSPTVVCDTVFLSGFSPLENKEKKFGLRARAPRYNSHYVQVRRSKCWKSLATGTFFNIFHVIYLRA